MAKREQEEVLAMRSNRLHGQPLPSSSKATAVVHGALDVAGKSIPPVKSCFRINVVNIALKKDVSSSMADAVLTRHSHRGGVASSSATESAFAARGSHQSLQDRYHLQSLLKLLGPRSAIKMTLVEQSHGNDDDDGESHRHRHQRQGAATSPTRAVRPERDAAARFDGIADTLVRSSLQGVDKVVDDARTGNPGQEKVAVPNAVELPLASFPAAVLLPATSEGVRTDARGSRGVAGDGDDDGSEESAGIRFEILQDHNTGHDGGGIAGVSSDGTGPEPTPGVLAKASSGGILRLSRSAVELMKGGTPVESTLSMSFMRHLPARRHAAAAGMRASVDGGFGEELHGLDAAMARVLGEIVLEVEVTMLPIMMMPMTMSSSMPMPLADIENINSYYEDDASIANGRDAGDSAETPSDVDERRVLLRVDSARIVRSATDAKASSLSSSSRPALPGCFVAIKSARMAADRVPATSQTSTRSADAASGNATLWGEVLALSMPQSSLHNEKVLVALVDAGGSGGGGRLLGKSVLPTAPLAMAWPRGRHVHLQLQLDAVGSSIARDGAGETSNEEEKILLNVSVCLEPSRVSRSDAGDRAENADDNDARQGAMRLSVGVGIDDGGVGDEESDARPRAANSSSRAPATPATTDTTLSAEILGAGTPAQADTKFRIVYKSVGSADAEAVERAMRALLTTTTTSDIVPGLTSWDVHGSGRAHHGARTHTDVCDAASVEDKVVRVRLTNLDGGRGRGAASKDSGSDGVDVNDAGNDGARDAAAEESPSSSRDADSGGDLESFSGVERLVRSARTEENETGSIMVVDIPVPEIARCLAQPTGHDSTGKSALELGSHVLTLPLQRVSLRLDIVVSSAAADDDDDDAEALERAAPVMVDIGAMSRSRAILSVSQLAIDAIAHQRTVRRLQEQSASANASMLLLAKKAIDECDMRVEAVRELEHVRSLLDEERRQRNAPQLLLPDISGTGSGCANGHSKVAIVGSSRPSKTDTARHVKEGLAYIHGLRDIDALRRACTTTFHHLIREQQRSRDAHARLKDLHQESIERQKMKKKYRELSDAHAQQQHIVAKLEESVSRCDRYKETIVGQERVISTLESLLTEASATSNSTAVSAGASIAKIESLEHARASLADKVAELEASLRTSETSAAETTRRKEEEYIARLARVETVGAEKIAALQSQIDDAKRLHEDHLQRSLADVEGINERNRQQVDDMKRQIESAKNAHADELSALRKRHEADIEAARASAAAAAEAAEKRAAPPPPPPPAPGPPPNVADNAKADEELRDLRHRLGEVQRELASKDEKLRQLNAEKLQLSMKCDKQETRAVSSENALLDATRKFARQIAELKSKLAEKDAALLGGFGAVSKMALNEMSGTGGGGGGVEKKSAVTELAPVASAAPASTAAASSAGFRMPTPPASLASLTRGGM